MHLFFFFKLLVYFFFIGASSYYKHLTHISIKLTIQRLAYFVSYLKVINTFLKIIDLIFKKMTKELKRVFNFQEVKGFISYG